MVDILLLVLSLVTGLLLVGAAAALLLRLRMVTTVRVLEKRVREAGETVLLGAVSARYCGADRGFSPVKNNGVLVLGEVHLYFQHLLEKTPSIVIPRAELSKVTVESSFHGEARTLAGGGYLVVHTGDGNRVGFLLKNADSVRTRLLDS